MVVMSSVTADKVNVNAANMPWEAETIEPTDTSSSSSEDAFASEATRDQSGKEVGAVGRTQSGRWSDLLDSAGMAQSPELLEEEPTGEEGEDDFAEELDEQESSGKTKRRTRRRRRNKKAASEASTASGGLRTPCSGLSTLSDMVESAEFFSTYPHTPSKFVGYGSTPCHSSPAARNGRSVVTCFDILGQELSLSPKTGAMQPSGMATAPRVASTVPTCTFKPIAEASTPTRGQDSYVEAGARSAAWYPQSPMAMNHWGASPMAHMPQSPLDNRQACLSMLGVSHHACTQDLAEQLRAVAPETYED